MKYICHKRFIKRIIGFLLFVVFVYLSIKLFSAEKLIYDTLSLFKHPIILLIMIGVYALSFLLRAYAWFLYLGKKASLSICLTSIWYSLFINHLFPIKVGDAVRVGFIASKEKNIKLDVAIHSVIVMRALDIGVLFLFSSVYFYFSFGNYLKISLSISIILMMIFAFCAIIAAIKFFPNIIMRHLQLLKNAISGRMGILILFLIASSWICEAIVIYEVAKTLYIPITYLQSIWANSITIAGQIFQFTPGGIATYETVMAFALSYLKIPGQEAYTMAIIAHGFKFLFSYLVGIYAILTAPISFKQMKYWITTKGVRAK